MIATQLTAADGRTWLAAGISRSGRGLGPAAEMASSLSSLIQLSTDAVLVADERLRDAVELSLQALWSEVPPDQDAFIVLTGRQPAPRVDPCYCEPTTSFLCSATVFARFLELGWDCWPQSLCYAILNAIANGLIDVDRLLVRQVPLPCPPALQNAAAPCGLVMPHRGHSRHLRIALQYLGRTTVAPAVRVGLDLADPAEYSAIVREFPAVEFFHACPSPLGPYVIRQDLAERSTEPLLTLQDSDDLSCRDRFAVLSDALSHNGCGIVGSHELCLDEVRGLVQPVRFPLDVSASLAICANHALLHGTMMLRRDVFLETGGLSTHHPIANDTQFLLRSFFRTRIRNVDEFLYVRRRHAESLTSAPSTVLDNPLRRTLSAEWKAGFDAVREGRQRLEESSLRQMRRTAPYRIDRWEPAAD